MLIIPRLFEPPVWTLRDPPFRKVSANQNALFYSRHQTMALALPSRRLYHNTHSCCEGNQKTIRKLTTKYKFKDTLQTRICKRQIFRSLPNFAPLIIGGAYCNTPIGSSFDHGIIGSSIVSSIFPSLSFRFISSVRNMPPILLRPFIFLDNYLLWHFTLVHFLSASCLADQKSIRKSHSQNIPWTYYIFIIPSPSVNNKSISVVSLLLHFDLIPFYKQNIQK